MFSPKIAPPPGGSSPPRNTLFFCSSGQAIHHPKRHLDLFSPKCYAVQWIVSGKENPKIAHSHWDFVTLPEQDRATTIGNIHKKW